ncbi:MAG: SMC-Scp complex subunit ScpB [Candidatus Marinimicrobia bacterium]|nr:SMC-Scp complex subunit ScpB [Candidatus Neomarinimicrobiota bacterium]
MTSPALEEEILQVTEVLLTASPEPLTQGRFNQSLKRDDVSLDEVVAALTRRFEDQQRPVEIVAVAGGYQLVTRAEYEPYLIRLFHRTGRLGLTRAALETMAVVAYRQPVTRSGIEQVRGVNSDGVLRSLLEKELVTIKGRDEGVGRPLLYGTTQGFLQAFGLRTLGDMPKLKEISEIMGEEEAPTPVSHAAE